MQGPNGENTFLDAQDPLVAHSEAADHGCPPAWDIPGFYQCDPPQQLQALQIWRLKLFPWQWRCGLDRFSSAGWTHPQNRFVACDLVQCGLVWALDIDSGSLCHWIDPPLGCWLGVALEWLVTTLRWCINTNLHIWMSFGWSIATSAAVCSTPLGTAAISSSGVEGSPISCLAAGLQGSALGAERS